jgi:uncharacterized membrane protein YjfL (UPF0719 family)
MNIEQYGIYALYALIYICFAVSLKYVLNFKSSALYNADDELSAGNLAVGLRRAGAQLGLAIAIMGVLSGSGAGSLLDDILASAIYGFLATIFIVSSLIVTDRFILPGINNLQALKDGNKAVGMVEFGMLTATGIIAYSSIVGEGGGILGSVVYFIVGQITLITLVLFYEKVILRKFNIIEAIGNKKLSSGIYLCGKLIAYALILKSAIAGNGSDNSTTNLILEYLFIAVSGMVLLYIFEYIIDLFIITTSTVTSILEQDLIVPALQLSAMKIGMALILSNAIL